MYKHNPFFSAVMMVRSTLFTVIVAALLITTRSCCSAENVYCVTPTATSCSSCPHDSTNCTTLSEYAKEAKLYFTSNTTMVFLPGDHTLDTNITAANIARLTMRGESSSGNRATVVCDGLVGLSFTSMVEFKIHSLAFTSCSRRYIFNLHTISLVTVHLALFLQSTQYTELVNCSFHDNHGTALAVNNTNITLSGNTEFKHNRACGDITAGGGIVVSDSNLTFTENTTFLNNSATIEQCPFVNSSSFAVGGAIATVNNSVLSFSGTSKFIGNSAGDQSRGGAIYASSNTVLKLNGTSNFINNSAYLGGAIYMAINTKMTFNGTIYFSNNGAKIDTQNGYTNGGGVFMRLGSTFSILPNTTVYWENNHASLGGAIYVENVSPTTYCISVVPLVLRVKCFFQLPGQNLSNGIDVQLVFKNNSADAAGSVLYGGSIDNCKLSHGLDSYGSGKVFDMIAYNNDTDYNTTSNISSNPFQICPCENYLPDCSKTEYNFPRTVYPGETFQAPVVAVGQRDGTVASRVISTINNIRYPDTSLQSTQHLQQANSACTKLNYTVFSLSQTVDIVLSAENSICTDNLLITVSLHQTCPPGFNFSKSARSCVCEPRLASYIETSQCDFITCTQCIIRNGVGQITRDSSKQFWVGYDDESNGVILYPQCPFDYCVSQTVTFPLTESDKQCAYNRSGLLCGACKEGYSLVLGTSRCRKCPNDYHLALLIPFAVMGVALVFLLLVCKLTVATGTLSGLIFYANIVEIIRTIFLPVESTNPLLSIFIAWLNLDFGIETCFYNGMDTYSNTWLQFVFPAYIWMLVGLMILVSHFSHRFAKLLGNNPVSVLATLILLSYAKILRTLIAVFYITSLQYPTYNRSVWLYDANVDFTSGKYIPLFIVAVLVFLFLFLPYTLLLLFGQWLQAISHLRLFSWVNRLKPFMDAYQAPYKAKHRYWPGLLLVLRFVLLLVFALNTQQNPSVNLLAILIEVVNLFLWLSISGGVYTNGYVNVLEGSFAFNLIILTTVSYIVNVLVGGQHFIVDFTWNASVFVALATFIGILAFQLANVTGITQYLKRKYTALKLAIRNRAEAAPKPPTGTLPHRLTNPEEYELTLQEHATASEPTEGVDDEAQEPVYTAWFDS